MRCLALVLFGCLVGCSGTAGGPIPDVADDGGDAGAPTGVLGPADAGGGPDGGDIPDATTSPGADAVAPAPPTDAAVHDACHPFTCADLGFTCGAAFDHCGGTLDCGTCGGLKTCQQVGSRMTCVAPVSDGGADAAATCGALNCAGCCWAGVCYQGTEDEICGIGGASCLNCEPSGMHCKGDESGSRACYH
jgi:hypothetical protein